MKAEITVFNTHTLVDIDLTTWCRTRIHQY